MNVAAYPVPASAATTFASGRLVWCAFGLWLWYAVSGFRPPAQPITLSDANEGAALRQLLFLGAAALSCWTLLIRGELSTLIAHRMRWFVLAGFLLASSAWSTAPELTVKRSMVFACGVVTLCTALHVSTRPIQSVLRTFAAVGGIVAWTSILLHLVLPESSTVHPARPGLAGIASHPNTLAPCLVVGFVLSLGLTASKKERRWLRVAQVGQLLALVMTESVTSWSLCLAATGITCLLNARAYLRGSVVNLAVFILIVLQLVGLSAVKSAALGAAGRDASLSGRDVLWQRVWDEASNRPWFGHGFGSFWTEGRGRALVDTWNPRQAHNAVLDVLIDLGFLGLAVVVVVAVGALPWGVRGWRGGEGSARRRAVSSLVGCSLGLCAVYGFGQSFFLKMDSYPFLALFCCLLLLTREVRAQPANAVTG